MGSFHVIRREGAPFVHQEILDVRYPEVVAERASLVESKAGPGPDTAAYVWRRFIGGVGEWREDEEAQEVSAAFKTSQPFEYFLAYAVHEGTNAASHLVAFTSVSDAVEWARQVGFFVWVRYAYEGAEFEDLDWDATPPDRRPDDRALRIWEGAPHGI